MSTAHSSAFPLEPSSQELTALGKRLEMFRIERGVSKQLVARRAGTSRQQLWRVMTGRSELTSSLRERLASALSVEPSALSPTSIANAAASESTARETGTSAQVLVTPATVAHYLADSRFLAATLQTLPSDEGGRRLKRALLNAVEDLALESGCALPSEHSDIRRRVLAGET